MKRVFIFSVILAFLVLPFASTYPDGLEKFAIDNKFLEASKSLELFKPPFVDYKIPFIKNDILKTGTAGLFGVIFVYGLILIVGKFHLEKKAK